MNLKWVRRLSRHHKAALENNAYIDFGDGVYYVVQQFCTELVAQRRFSNYNIKSLFEHDDGGLEYEISDWVLQWVDPSVERLKILSLATCSECGGPICRVDKTRCDDCRRGIVFSPFFQP